MAIVVIDPGHGGMGKVGGSSATTPPRRLGCWRRTSPSRSPATRRRRSAPVATPCGSPAPRTSTCRSWTAPRWRNPRKLTPSSRFISTASATPPCRAPRRGCTRDGSAPSVELAGCVQRAVLQATRHETVASGEGARRGRPRQSRAGHGCVPGGAQFHHHDGGGCAAARSGVSEALGDAIANGVQEFVGQQDVLDASTAAAAECEQTIATAGRAAAFRTRSTFSASTTVSPTAAAVATMRPPLADVRQAIDALPKKGRKTKYAGPVASGGDGDSHIQGLAGYKDVFLLTHSDERRTVGTHPGAGPCRRAQVRHGVPAAHFSTSGPSFFHAGGCQLIGDVLAVPSESGKNASVIAFFDVSDPMHIGSSTARCASRATRATPRRWASRPSCATGRPCGSSPSTTAAPWTSTSRRTSRAARSSSRGSRAGWGRRTTSTCCSSPIRRTGCSRWV